MLSGGHFPFSVTRVYFLSCYLTLIAPPRAVIVSPLLLLLLPLRLLSLLSLRPLLSLLLVMFVFSSSTSTRISERRAKRPASAVGTRPTTWSTSNTAAASSRAAGANAYLPRIQTPNPSTAPST